jgi:isoaspartyl peptidase/L-asparaginase-like protein (Ntn-hydrolase superfamily)
MRVMLAQSVLAQLSGADDASTAVSNALESMRHKTGGCGGVILLTADGTAVADFTTEKMP